jgi:hypothetical protein
VMNRTRARGDQHSLCSCGGGVEKLDAGIFHVVEKYDPLQKQAQIGNGGVSNDVWMGEI